MRAGILRSTLAAYFLGAVLLLSVSCKAPAGSSAPAGSAGPETAAPPAGAPAAPATPAKIEPVAPIPAATAAAPASIGPGKEAPAAAPGTPPAQGTPPAAPATPPVPENVVLTLETGQVVLRLFDRDAPVHAENFKALVNAGYFTGTTFHRACWGFVQGGDPTGTGKGGVEKTIPSEIKRPLLRGSLVAARKPDESNPKRDSHGSQFFILLNPQYPWNGQYTVLGHVLRGLDLLAKIPQGDKDNDYLVPAGKGVKILKAEVMQGLPSFPTARPQAPAAPAAPTAHFAPAGPQAPPVPQAPAVPPVLVPPPSSSPDKE